jgi:preprotein translocase subunit SecG
MGLKRFALIILIVLLVLVFFISPGSSEGRGNRMDRGGGRRFRHRSRQASRRLNFEPHAAKEVEKAKRAR